MLDKSKKMKALVSTTIVLVGLACVSCFVSYTKFGVANPISVGVGLYKIVFTDTEYVELHQYPRVILSKSDNAQKRLVEFMENNGYIEDEENRMGSTLRFENGISANYIQLSTNKYYSKWRWRE